MVSRNSWICSDRLPMPEKGAWPGSTMDLLKTRVSSSESNTMVNMVISRAIHELTSNARKSHDKKGQLEKE